jgi:hypothetical protein
MGRFERMHSGTSNVLPCPSKWALTAAVQGMRPDSSCQIQVPRCRSCNSDSVQWLTTYPPLSWKSTPILTAPYFHNIVP